MNTLKARLRSYAGKAVDASRRLKMGLLDAWVFSAAVFGHRPRSSNILPGGGEGLVVMLVISELWIDPRVRRAATALVAGGYQVRIVYPDFFSELRKLGPLDWGPGIEFRPLPGDYAWFANGFPWVLGKDYLRAVEEERPDVIHCHDLNTSIIGLAAAGKIGCHCVCDFHEWFSENVSWDFSSKQYLPHPPLHKFIYWLSEFIVMHRATEVITVCDSIANDLRTARYLSKRHVHVIRNIPETTRGAPATYRSVKEEVGVPEDTFVLLWQGGVGPTRLIEPIIEAVGLVENVVFVIRGPVIESFQDEYYALAERSGAGGRVFCVPPVPSELVVAGACSADLGVWSLPNLARNFYYSLPNKIFEYLAAGLPIIGANFPEARKIIEGYGVGVTFDPYQPLSIAAAIRRFSGDPEFTARCRANIAQANSSLDVDAEWRKLVTLYDDLLGRTTGNERESACRTPS